MHKTIIICLLLFICSSLIACTGEEAAVPMSEPETVIEPEPKPEPSTYLTIKNMTPISTHFIGNGAQWGGFEIIESWTGIDDFNDSDWATLKLRLDFMRPPFIRIMISAGWNYLEGEDTFKPARATQAFHRMMQYCTDNNITVMFGEWGHLFLNEDRSQINYQWLDYTVDYLDHLINDKGYTAIKYYNMINEPNGSWASTQGDYAIWSNVVAEFISRLKAKGLNQQVEVAGPDIAVFTDANVHCTD